MNRQRLRYDLDRIWRLRRRPPREVLGFVRQRVTRRVRSMVECRLGRPLTRRVGPRALLQAISGPAGHTGLAPLRSREQIAAALSELHAYVVGTVAPLAPAAANADFAAAFAGVFPDAARWVIEHADEALAHRFDLLGSGMIEYGPALDWHTDPVAGKTWPLVPSSCIEPLGIGQPWDIKRPWELSRHQWLPTLAHAYRLSGDERYARDAIRTMTAWIADNPPGAGINWLIPMELGLRLFSWALTLDHVRESPSLTPAVLGRILSSVLAHARYILANQEKSPLAGNHYVANGFGLVVAGLAFPFFKESDRWLAEGLHILDSEIVRQVYADGVDYEQSTDYHRFVGEMWALTALLLQSHGRPVPGNIRQRLERMLEFSRDVTAPDGLTPQLADSDDGFVLRLTGRVADDHRLLLALGTLLNDRADFRAVAGPYPADVWLLFGEAGRRTYDAAMGRADAGVSRAYPQGGYYILRDGQRLDAFFSVIDCGHLGMGPGQYGGHGHADTLSFVCSAFGRPLLVDPGTFTYTGSVEWRNYFRSTSAHNALTVDGLDVAELGATWSMVNKCRPVPLGWAVGRQITAFDGLHTGYQRLTSPVIHRRSFLLRHDAYWLLIDAVYGEGEHTVERFFHLPPGANAVARDASVVATLSGGIELTLCFPPAVHPTEERTPAALLVEPAQHSPRYGVQEPATVVHLRERVRLPVLLPVLIAPSRERLADVRFVFDAGADGAHIEVARDGKREELWFRGTLWDADPASATWEVRSAAGSEQVTLMRTADPLHMGQQGGQ